MDPNPCTLTLMGFNLIWIFKIPESQIKQTNEQTLDQTKTNNSIKSPTVYAICSRTKMRNEPLTDGPKPKMDLITCTQTK